MKKTTFTKHFTSQKIKQILSLLIVLLMIFLSTACSSSKKNDNNSQASDTTSQNNSINTSQNGSSSNNSSGESSSDASSKNSSTNSSSNKATQNTSKGDGSSKGQISTQDKTPSKPKPSTPLDENEVKVVVDPANLISNYKGYANTERNKRLKEILNTPNTLELYDVKGKIYYVSTKGNDENDGLTPKTAIQNLSAVASLPLKKGDAVLFERGGIWRMQQPFQCKSNITYGSYGKGKKPLFLGSPKNYAQEKWKPSKKKNVWQISYMYDYPCGAFFDQGKEAGYLKTDLQSLTANTHFFYEESIATLYLYCDKGDPSTVWSSIDFSQAGVRINLHTGVNNVVVDNIAIRYAGQGGIGGTYANHHFTVTNCEIGFVGGAWLGDDPSSNLRFCNGIETWCGGEYLTWDHNWIYQTFDSAMSPQGRNGGAYHDISMSNNLLEFNNCDIETWETNAESPAKYYNYFMDNNICRFTSLGWGTRADDGGIRGIDGVHYGHLKKDQITGKFSFSNNIIDCPGRMIYKFDIANKACYDKWIRKNNVYYIKQSLRTTNSLTYCFHWEDNNNRVTWHSGDTEEKVLNAFAEFEPNSKVYWYN